MKLKIKEMSSSGGDHGPLDNYRVKRETFKNKKLTKHFVKLLLQKFELPEGIIEKCLKVPLSVYSKVLDISHAIVNGKAGFGKLADLRALMCDELKVIPDRLNDVKIFNDIRNYLYKHVKTLTR